jgi:hypothetical protein
MLYNHTYLKFPGLEIPKIMQEMNYGCGSTISAQDLINNQKILYGSWRRNGVTTILLLSQKRGVVGVDVVDEMLEASRQNFYNRRARK